MNARSRVEEIDAGVRARRAERERPKTLDELAAGLTTTDLTEDEKVAVVRHRLQREKAELHRRINEIDALLSVKRGGEEDGRR